MSSRNRVCVSILAGFFLVLASILISQAPNAESQTRPSSPEDVAPNFGCLCGVSQQADGSCVYQSCPAGKQFDTGTCACVCSSGVQCNNGSCLNCTSPKTVANSTTCSCSCPANPGCTLPHQTNSSTCACECPTCPAGKVLTDPFTCQCACASPCPAGQTQNANCSCSCPTATPVLSNGICCRSGQDNSDNSGRCCPTNQDWASVSNICCTSSRIATDGTCCARSLSNGLCCASGQDNSDNSGHCCPSGQNWASASNTCCSTSILASNGTCCAAPTPFLVNGACSACSGANRTKRTGSTEADGCCPNNEPFVLGGVCSSSSCALRFRVGGTSGNNFRDDYDRTSNTPTCVDNIVAVCRSSYGTSAVSDNNIASCITNGLHDGSNVVNRNNCYGQPPGCIVDPYYRNTSIYFDSQCNGLPTNLPSSQICDAGRYTFSISPIVLLWEKSFGVEDLSKDVRLVSFPLDPNKPDQLVEWKASSEAPLLVYDPKGDGKIHSAYELFGNWTFGSRELASLDATKVINKDKIWNNGFEALAKLDLNKDGEVSGDELSPLSLWFDNNKNAVSEEGEVVRLTSTGVKKLFYKGYETNLPAHAIELKVGFEREQNGVVEQGTMVDWFAESAGSEFEYAQKSMIDSTFSKIANKQEAEKSDIKQIPREEIAAYKNGASLVRGVWKWTTESSKVPASGGTFVIVDNNDGTISGITMIELPLESSFNATSVARVVSITGSAKQEKDGSVSLNFELSKDIDAKVKSTAKLNLAGDTLSGSSKTLVKNQSANTEVKYSWTAKRPK